MNTHIPAAALAPEGAWFKSSYSTQDNGNCVEIAALTSEVGVRDSKVADGPALRVRPAAWSAFVEFIRN
ncbi:DUF397 domain-containing protein [Streptomyces rimosus]|uniref:DUF397 domain-containing protein n=1 Tax=Streptomyces rimosus TaxID=1927 RepID=UPI000AAB2EB5|nr:DUF397 domain-containing protein [Streptomyces rimosus]